tara:strand:- start:456 stop:2057 length:1602 start_codon:yes stop_codon:yes gene_type:complete
MMDEPMLITDLLVHAAACHGDGEIVSRCFDGSIHRYTYIDAHKRAKQLANALVALGAECDDRVGTLAWNHHRHFELYYAVSGMAAVAHTINPRMSAEQISYIINHADDAFIFLDIDFVPLLESIKDEIRGVKSFVILVDKVNMPETILDNVLCYEELIERESDFFEWPTFTENTAASLCYTSGTTGNPKGVLYSHRSAILHARAVAGAEGWALDSFSSVLAVVPMFHASGWGLPYSATMLGAKLVMPGGSLDGESVYELIKSEQVDSMCGVPTVWQSLLQYLDKAGEKLDSVEKTIIGGSAVPLSMIEEFDEKHDVFVMHGWGMTEMSPVGAVNYLTPALKALPKNERYQLQLKQGKPLYGVKMKIVNDEGVEQPHDGKSFGHLLVRGPWVATSYYDNDDRSDFTEDGWFDTGDISTLDENGYMQIVDRAKDVIKSGGEWISSIKLESAASMHEQVTEVCVIGVAHPKWGERPLMLVTATAQITTQQMCDYLSKDLPRMWLPDQVIVVDELPHNATGKLMKKQLRVQYKDYFS